MWILVGAALAALAAAVLVYRLVRPERDEELGWMSPVWVAEHRGVVAAE